MEAPRFDTLTKELAKSRDRRRFFGAMAGLLAGGTASVVKVNAGSAAGGRGEGQTCRNASECTSGGCAIASDGRRRCCPQNCYNCGIIETQICCEPACPN